MELAARELHKNWPATFKDRAHNLLIPMPSTKGRLKQRGMHHMLFLAQQLHFRLPTSATCIAPVLGLSPGVRAQTDIPSTSGRIRNIVNGMTLSSPDRIIDKNILLLDDVLTTGASLCSAASLLLGAGAKTVSALTLASTDSMTAARQSLQQSLPLSPCW